MNVKNLAKQCEMVIKLSNGVTNNELDLVYRTATSMVENGMAKSTKLIYRDIPDDVNLVDVCAYMRNLRVWHFYVIADMKHQYQWKQVATMRDIVQIGDEYAIEYKA